MTSTSIEQLQGETILAWVAANDIRTESGVPLDFNRHRYLIDIYRDDSPNLVEMKAAQLGLSTMEIFRTLWKAYYHHLDIIYILPTATDIQDFAGGKVNRIVDNNPVLQGWVKDKDSTVQKRIGGSTIYYRGSWNERQALMITADWLILDEFDRCKQEVLEQYESRLQHSKYGYKSIFSNPSAPDFGVHKYYKKGDQKKWFVTPEACGHEIVLDEKTIDYDAKAFKCTVCSGPITDEDRRLGEWQSTAAGEEGWSSYWLPLWINPDVPASKIAEHKRGKTAEYFSNFVAGEPFVGGGNTVAYETVAQNVRDLVNPQDDRIIIGVDTGLPIHYVIANKTGFFHYGKCQDPTTGVDPYKELEAFLIRWPNSIIVADQGGDLVGIRLLQAKYPGRVFLVWYRPDRKTQTLIKWGEGDEYGSVVADRNRVMQLFIDEMLEKRMTYNGTREDWHDYITHWLNIYRVWESDDAGLVDKTKGFKWERQGPDHWVHAAIYARIGLDKFRDTKAKIVGADPFEGIPVGRTFKDSYDYL